MYLAFCKPSGESGNPIKIISLPSTQQLIVIQILRCMDIYAAHIFYAPTDLADASSLHNPESTDFPHFIVLNPCALIFVMFPISRF